MTEEDLTFARYSVRIKRVNLDERKVLRFSWDSKIDEVKFSFKNSIDLAS